MNINFNANAFLDNIAYMGKGMLGIFAVIGIIIAVTAVLNLLSSNKKK